MRFSAVSQHTRDSLKKTPHSFPFFAVDWLSSTAVSAMTLAEEGCYIRLLAYMAEDETCSLPSDPALLARLCKHTTPDTVQAILGSFIPHPTMAGRITHRKLIECRDMAIKARERLSLAGQASARQRTLCASNTSNGPNRPSSVQHPFNGRSTPVQQTFNTCSTDVQPPKPKPKPKPLTDNNRAAGPSAQKAAESEQPEQKANSTNGVIPEPLASSDVKAESLAVSGKIMLPAPALATPCVDWGICGEAMRRHGWLSEREIRTVLRGIKDHCEKGGKVPTDMGMLRYVAACLSGKARESTTKLDNRVGYVIHLATNGYAPAPYYLDSAKTLLAVADSSRADPAVKARIDDLLKNLFQGPSVVPAGCSKNINSCA